MPTKRIILYPDHSIGHRLWKKCQKTRYRFVRPHSARYVAQMEEISTWIQFVPNQSMKKTFVYEFQRLHEPRAFSWDRVQAALRNLLSARRKGAQYHVL